MGNDFGYAEKRGWTQIFFDESPHFAGEVGAVLRGHVPSVSLLERTVCQQRKYAILKKSFME